MAVAWSIQIGNGAAQQFRDLGLSKLRRTLVHAAADTVSFTAPGYGFDKAALISYGQTVKIYKDNECWFHGRCQNNPRRGSGRRESVTYDLVGPWWYLEHIVYLQDWALWEKKQLISYPKPHVVLGQSSAGTSITTGAQIKDVIERAIAAGMPINTLQLGAIDPGIHVPWDERVNITCAEAIVAMLRWTPGVICWFDYTSTPLPSFHCHDVSTLSAVTLPLWVTPPAPAQVTEFEICPRNDLKVPGVRLIFETHTSVDDDDKPLPEMYESYTLQEAGSPNEIGAFQACIDFTGSRSMVSEKFVCGYFPDAPNDPPEHTCQDLEDARSWWEEESIEMKAIAGMDPNYVIEEASREAGGGDRYVVSGTQQPWMQELMPELEFKLVAVTALVSYDNLGADGVVCDRVKRQPVIVRKLATNAKTTVYRKLTNADWEVEPPGLAKALFDWWGQLQFEGVVVMTEEDVRGTVVLGKLLNLSGGLGVWASMKAQVTQVVEAVDSGTTTVYFGPAKHITLDELVGTLAALRAQHIAWGALSRISGNVADNGAMVQNLTSGPVDTTNLKGERRMMRIAHYPPLPSKQVDKQIVLDPEAMVKYNVLTVSEFPDGSQLSQFGWVRAHV